jgi:hypothetical protein
MDIGWSENQCMYAMLLYTSILHDSNGIFIYLFLLDNDAYALSSG